MEEKMINKKYRVTATILTPLHIGAGAEKDWVEGMDFIVKDDTLWHLDLDKILAGGIDIDKLTSLFVAGKANEIKTLIGNKLQQVSDFQMEMPCSASNPIKVFLRNQLTGNPVLAGSSLKGAIRSILFTYLRVHERTNEEVFGSMKDGSDFLRFIRISDFEFEPNSTELVNTKIYNLEGGQGHWSGGWKHRGGIDGETTTKFKETGFNTIYECLPYGVSAHGTLMIANTLFNALVQNNRTISHLQGKAGIINNPIQGFCNIINKHTRKYLDKERAFFTKFSQAECADYLYADEEDFSGCIRILTGELANLKPNECILKMSAGSGFHSITGDWLFNDYTNGQLDRKRNRGENVLPKSRKIAITYDGDNMFLDLMGFVKLSFEE